MESEGSNDDGFPTQGGDAMQFGEDDGSSDQQEEMSGSDQQEAPFTNPAKNPPPAVTKKT